MSFDKEIKFPLFDKEWIKFTISNIFSSSKPKSKEVQLFLDEELSKVIDDVIKEEL